MWGVMQHCVDQTPIQDVADLLRQSWLILGVASRKALRMMPLMNGVRDFMPEWMKKGGHFEHLLKYYDSTVQKN